MIIIAANYGVTEITIEKRPYQFKYLNIEHNYAPGLLAYLLQRRFIQSSRSKLPPRNCKTKDIFVNYIFEYDIHNQAFNSSFQDLDSFVVQNLQSRLADVASDELYKRNLAPYIKSKVHLTKIVDVSEQYDNRSTIRLYVSINLYKNFIPVMRNVFETAFEKIQQEQFSTTKKNIDWGNMVIISKRK